MALRDRRRKENSGRSRNSRDADRSASDFQICRLVEIKAGQRFQG